MPQWHRSVRHCRTKTGPHELKEISNEKYFRK
jgi:hypothetical protein